MHYGFCRKHADQTGEGGCPECAMEHQQTDILALRAKLAEAEERYKDLLRDHTLSAGDVLLWQSRAEAAEKKLEIAINATAPQVDAMLAAKLEVAEAEAKEANRLMKLAHDVIRKVWDKVPRLRDGELSASLIDRVEEICTERDRLQAEVARLTSEVKEWLCDTCNTVYPGPPQKGVWCVVCPSCGGNTAPTKTIELRKANARISELEAAIRGWYEWRFNDDPSDRPLDRINDIANRLLDGRGEK